MASVMASRFSVLKIEDDSDQEREKAARKKAAEDEKAKKKTNKKKKRSKTTETADAELQSMAFGLPKPKQQAKQQKQQQQQQQSPPPPPPKAGSESSRKASESEQNEWERRDQALIDEAFERDLQQAMIMSRVELERAATETPPEASANGHHEPTAKAKAKKAKSNVLSVDQLQTLSTSQIDRGDFRSVQPAAAAPSRPPLAAAAGGGDFFDQVERKTKEAVNREKIIERIRQDLPPSQAGASPSALAVPPEVGLRLATAESRVEELTAELEETRDQVRQAKSRTKRVLSVLTQSETREKVQLIVGLEKAQAARDAADKERAEMSAQVTALLAQLEQERSKVHQLTTQLKRAQGNKRRGQSENDTADGVD